MWYLEDFWEFLGRSYLGDFTWYLRKSLQPKIFNLKAICCSETKIVLKELSICVKEFVSLKLLWFRYKAILKQAWSDFRSQTKKRDKPSRLFFHSRKLALQIRPAHLIYICYLPGGRSVWEKNCARGLEYSRPRAQFFPIRTDLARQITYLFFSCSKLVLQPLTNGFVYATLSLNRVARRLLTICKKSLQRTSWVTQILDKKRCIKEQIFFDLLYISCIYVTCTC